MYSSYLSWSRYAFLAGLALALILVIPVGWLPLQLLKIAAFAACLAVAALLFVMGGGARDLGRTHGLGWALLVALLPLSYVVSHFFSVDRAVAWSGLSIETDTIAFGTLAALAFVLAFNLFRTLRTARMLTTVVFWALAAAVLFQCVSVAFGTSVIPFQAFADRSVNLVGKWNDLGLLSALLVLFLFVRVELAGASRAWRAGAWASTAVLAVLLAFINFPLAWGMLLAGCAAIGLLALLRRRADAGSEEGFPRLPHYALAGLALSILFLLYGSAINASLTKAVPVSSLEVRPSIQSTLDIGSKARAGSLARAFIGTGPNTFGEEWLLYKPVEVNQSPFWNLDFNVGFSTLATALVSAGLVGALAWLVPVLLVLMALVRAVRLGVLSREERIVAATLTAGALFLFAAVALYVPSANVLLLGFVMAGAAFGFLWRQGRPGDADDMQGGIMAGLKVLALAAVVLVFAGFAGFTAARRLLSQSYVGLGLTSLAAGNADAAIAYGERAASLDNTTDAARLRADAGLQKLATIANDKTLAIDDARTQFTNEVQEALPAGQAAVILAPGDYRGYYSIARIYDYLASLKVEGAYSNAKAAYNAAAVHNPTSPVIQLALARLEAAVGSPADMATDLQKSLTLKPDYTDAILFAVQINIAQNDLPSAIRNATAAVKSAPGVPSIWFELGLLYYAGGDTKNAVSALEQAIALVPEYANAKYFLALSYYAQGRKDDAQKLFEDLAASNPDNAEVKTILDNLKAGKAPLAGETPPTQRSQAPISQ